MDKPDDKRAFEFFLSDDAEKAAKHLLTQAKNELAYEKFRKAVEEKKFELLTNTPFWYRVFPYRLNIERIKNK